MLDMKQIREDPENVRQALLKRMDSLDLGDLLEWDSQKTSV